jgi:hypothetical protein
LIIISTRAANSPKTDHRNAENTAPTVKFGILSLISHLNTFVEVLAASLIEKKVNRERAIIAE